MSCEIAQTLGSTSQGHRLIVLKARRPVSRSKGQPFCAMETSAELRAKRAGFLARFDIGLKISKGERNEPQLRYHHNQTKESFRLDRIEKVLHKVSEEFETPFGEKNVESISEDDRFFLISSKNFRRSLTAHSSHRRSSWRKRKKGI